MTEALAGPARDMTGPLSQIREQVLAEYRPAGDAIVAKTGVSVSETTVADVTCMVIDPPAPHPTRKIVYAFGGGFVLGSPFEDIPISATLAVLTGAQVICPHYPLAPENPFPAGLEACIAVAQDVLSKHPNTCLVGESAGGNLALATALRLKGIGVSLPRALALLSPAADMQDWGDSHLADRDPFLRANDMTFFQDLYLPKADVGQNPDISPIYGAFDASFPPVITTTGTRDMLLSVCVRLDRVLREAGVASTLRVWEGLWHVFEFYPEIPEAGASLRDIASFLEHHFQPG